MTSARIDWDEVERRLSQKPWTEGPDGAAERSVSLGSVFSLLPSGKYYTLWALPNLAPCPDCRGEGKTRAGNKSDQPQGTASPEASNGNGRITCQRCGGSGSEEAYLDQLWWEDAQLQAEEHGLIITSGKEDPTDVVVVQTRKPAVPSSTS